MTDRVFFRHCEAAEDWLESTEAEQLSPEEIVKVASEIGKIIVAQDACDEYKNSSLHSLLSVYFAACPPSILT